MIFAGLRVLELGSLASASWCARLFADFGADVLKLEPDGGDPLRHAAPLFDNDGAKESAAFAFLNFGKRIARENEADLAALRRCSRTPARRKAPPSLFSILASVSRVNARPICPRCSPIATFWCWATAMRPQAFQPTHPSS